MEIKNCKRCGRIFQYTGVGICNGCISQDDEDFRKVKDYLIDHPGAALLEVSERTGVEMKVITRFLREGRLESEEFELEEGGLECDSCHRPIKAGRFCSQCADALQQGFSKAAQSFDTDKNDKPKPSGSSLHTYNAIVNKKS